MSVTSPHLRGSRRSRGSCPVISPIYAIHSSVRKTLTPARASWPPIIMNQERHRDPSSHHVISDRTTERHNDFKAKPNRTAHTDAFFVYAVYSSPDCRYCNRVSRNHLASATLARCALCLCGKVRAYIVCMSSHCLDFTRSRASSLRTKRNGESLRTRSTTARTCGFAFGSRAVLIE